MACMPVVPQGKDGTALNWRFTVVAACREEFIVVKVAIETLLLGDKVELRMLKLHAAMPAPEAVNVQVHTVGLNNALVTFDTLAAHGT